MGSHFPGMNSTPASLLEQLRYSADGSAWQRFVQLYTPLLHAWAWRAGLQAQDAADLVQEVFLLLLQKLPEFEYRPDQSFRAWLRTVTLNKWREHCRRKPGGGQPLGTLNNGLADPEATHLFDETEHRHFLVRRALQLMQADFQPATWKACWQLVTTDRPVTEVAAELGLTVKAAYLAKSRVLRRLRQELAGLLG